jgi:hypothetical protein
MYFFRTRIFLVSRSLDGKFYRKKDSPDQAGESLENPVKPGDLSALHMEFIAGT